VSLLSDILKPVQDEAEKEASKILSGQYNSDHVKLVSAIERRKGLLVAIDKIRERAKHDDESEA
jgi:hypothetical protein